MFSSRVAADLTPNRLARVVEACRREGRPLIDMTLSNPTRAGFLYPESLLRALSAPGALAYAPAPFGTADARAAVSADFARRGFDVPPERIILTSSTSEAYSLLFKLLCNAGDEVLLPKPSYPLFEHLTRLDEVHARFYDVEFHGAWSIDTAGLRRAIGDRTRAALVVSPNNPTGSVLKSDELEEIAPVCAERRLAIIADEVFDDYDLEPGPSCQRARIVDLREGLAFSLGGLSKSVGLPQVKLGWIAVAGDAAVVQDALERLELICDTYLSVSTPVQEAARELLDRGASIREQIQARVRANFRHARALTAGTACSVLPAEGGWYAVLKVPALCPEEDLVVSLVENRGVLAHPGYFFDFSRESFLVVSLLVPEAEFGEALARIVRHFDCNA